MFGRAYPKQLAAAGQCVIAALLCLGTPAPAGDLDPFPDFALRVSALSTQADKGLVDRSRQVDLVTERLETTRSKRLTGHNMNTSSLVIRFAGRNAAESAAFETKRRLSPEEARRTNRLALWFGGSVDVDSQRADDPRLATVHTDGITFGTDARLGPRLLVGNAIGTGFDRTGLAEKGWLGSRYISDTLYASAFTGRKTYLDIAAGAAWTRFDARYGETGAGSRDARQVYATARYSRKFRKSRLQLRPFGEAGLSRTMFGHYREYGSGLSCPSQSARSLHASLGLRGQTAVDTRVGEIAPRAGLDFTRTMKRVSSAVIAVPGTDRQRQVSASVVRYGTFAANTGMRWSISKNATLDGQYALSADLSDFRPEQSITARFNLSF